MQEKIQQILNENLPKEVIGICKPYRIMSTDYLGIHIYTGEKLINDVRGQYMNHASLSYNIVFEELESQVFGLSGGTRLYRNIDLNNPKENYLAMKGEKIPFRKTTGEAKVLRAVERFCKAYINTLQSIKDKGLLRHTKDVDYSFLK